MSLPVCSLQELSEEIEDYTQRFNTEDQLEWNLVLQEVAAFIEVRSPPTEILLVTISFSRYGKIVIFVDMQWGRRRSLSFHFLLGDILGHHYSSNRFFLTGRSCGCPERQQFCRHHQQSPAGGKCASAGTRHGGWTAHPCWRTNHRQL